jgi:hypothetical protein
MMHLGKYRLPMNQEVLYGLKEQVLTDAWWTHVQKHRASKSVAIFPHLVV